MITKEIKFVMETQAFDTIDLSDKDFCRISDMVYEHCGIDLHDGKKELVRARLTKILRNRNFQCFDQYVNYVLDDTTGKEFTILIDSLSTNLTSFFREQQHFKFMSDNFLPSLIKQKQNKQNFRIRGWSAGCSSGEEPYSIAIVLREALYQQNQWDVRLLATDISTRMLEKAQQGIYSKKRIETVPSLQRNRYIMQRNINGQTMYQVTEFLRNIVVFRYLNLMNDWPIKGPLDFIFCRNVMIYFDKPTQINLINRFWEILDYGGILFTGHSELLTTIEHKFEYVQPTVYMKL
jgi:chemotaxis protein methyltransferase CheR